MTGQVVHFPRPPELIEADVQAELARHAETMSRLWAERAGQPVRSGGLGAVPTAERMDNKARAAAALGIDEQTLTRFVLDYHDEHPDRLPLAIQPGELKGTPWVVFTDRVRAARESGKPIRRRSVKLNQR